MKGEWKFSPVTGRFQDVRSRGRRGMKGEGRRWVVVEGVEGGKVWDESTL